MRLGIDRALVWQLGGLALLAFLFRLVPMLLTGGIQGYVDYDDGVYMGTALAFVRNRIVYRDFYMLHPPGIVYVLLPFASLSWFASDAAAFGAARAGFMLLGALNTFLVGLVAARFGRTAALASAALYAVWIVAAKIERSTWLIAPQNTLLLLALLALAPFLAGTAGGSITWRRAALVGALIGFCGVIQIWGVVTAGVFFVWLFVRTARQPGGWLKPLAGYTVAGVATVAIAFLPFLAAAGEKMIRIVIFDQIGRGEGGVGIGARLRQMEGIPPAVVARFHLELLPIVIFVVAGLAILFVAWRRPVVRLWAALYFVQATFLLITPSFFGHYPGWLAPAAALSIGSVAALAIDSARDAPRRATAIKAIYGAGLAALLVVTLAPPLFGQPGPSKPFPAAAIADVIGDARCPTGDSAATLILSGMLRRMLDNDCPLLVSPTGVSYDTDANLVGKDRTRPKQPEYQAVMQAYYGGSDAATFNRAEKNNGFSAATWAVIRGHLPVQHDVGSVMILLPAP